MGNQFDSPLKWLLVHVPRVFLQRIGITTSASLRFLNVEQQVNVTSLMDGILLDEEDLPYAVHFEFDSRRVPDGVSRLLRYNVIAAQQRGVPVLAVLVLLRLEADAPEYTGVNEVWFPGRVEALHVFRYVVIRVWELDPLTLLENAGTIPLAPVLRVEEDDMPSLLDQVEEKLAGLDRTTMLDCVTQMGLRMGLRFDGQTVEKFLRRFAGMKESAFYQTFINGANRLGSRSGAGGAGSGVAGKLLRLGPVPEAVERKLPETEDLDLLARLLERVTLVNSWDEVESSC